MKLDGGKYEIKHEGDRVIAYRHGERWRELTGDNLIYWLMARITELEAQQEVVEKNRDNWEQRCGQALADRDRLDAGLAEIENNAHILGWAPAAALAKKTRAGEDEELCK